MVDPVLELKNFLATVDWNTDDNDSEYEPLFKIVATSEEMVKIRRCDGNDFVVWKCELPKVMIDYRGSALSFELSLAKNGFQKGLTKSDVIRRYL